MKKKLLFIGLAAAIILLGGLGCAVREEVTMPSFAPTPLPGVPEISYSKVTGSGFSDEEWAYDQQANDFNIGDRMIVRTGNISMVVEDIAGSLDTVDELATALNGYVVNSHRWGENENSRGTISIRVPADRYEEALDSLRALAIEVVSESTDSRDVTEEYTDLQSRLNNLEAAEEQYLLIMSKAEEVEDILQVQRELVNVREDIERIQGQMLYLERTSATSLIAVDLSVKKTPIETGWRANDTLDSAIRGVVRFGQILANIFIWLGIFCFVWIPPLVIWFRRRRKEQKENEQAESQN